MSTPSPPQPQAHLALDEHVEELVPRLLWVPVPAQTAQVAVGDAQPRQAAHAGPLVVQPAALGAGNEVQELLGLRGGCQRGLGCGGKVEGGGPPRARSAGAQPRPPRSPGAWGSQGCLCWPQTPAALGCPCRRPHALPRGLLGDGRKAWLPTPAQSPPCALTWCVRGAGMMTRFPGCSFGRGGGRGGDKGHFCSWCAPSPRNKGSRGTVGEGGRERGKDKRSCTGDTHRPSPPGWGQLWPRRPRAGPPPGGSAGRPFGCSGTCSAGQRSTLRRRMGPEGCSGGGGQRQSALALAQPQWPGSGHQALRPLDATEGAAQPGIRSGPSPHLPILLPASALSRPPLSSHTLPPNPSLPSWSAPRPAQSPPLPSSVPVPHAPQPLPRGTLSHACVSPCHELHLCPPLWGPGTQHSTHRCLPNGQINQ